MSRGRILKASTPWHAPATTARAMPCRRLAARLTAAVCSPAWKPNPDEIRRLRRQALLDATVLTPGHEYAASQSCARKHGLVAPKLPSGASISANLAVSFET